MYKNTHVTKRKNKQAKKKNTHGSFMYNRKKPRSNTNVFSVEWIYNAEESWRY